MDTALIRNMCTIVCTIFPFTLVRMDINFDYSESRTPYVNKYIKFEITANLVLRTYQIFNYSESHTAYVDIYIYIYIYLKSPLISDLVRHM